MKKLIKNVVQLDMTAATPESVEGVTINNAVNVFVTPATKPLLSKMNIGNMVRVREIPDGAAISSMNGNIEIGGGAFDGDANRKAFMKINGSILVKNDVSPEAFQQIFSCGGDVNGNITLPDNLAALVSSVHLSVNGNIDVYPADSILYTESLTINNGFLTGLPEGAKLTVMGGVTVSADTDPALFETHIAQLTVFGDAVVPAALKDTFYKVLQKSEGVTVLPEGYTLYDKTLTLAAASLFTVKNKKLYTRENIIINDGLTENQIRQTDFQLETEGAVFCPEKLADCIFEKVKARDFYTYRGKLVVSDESAGLILPPEGEDGLFSYLVNEELNMDATVTAEDIKAYVGEIFLYGTINLYETQRRAVTEKIVVNDGSLEIMYDEEEDEDDGGNNDNEECEDNGEDEYDIVIGNAVQYVL